MYMEARLRRPIDIGSHFISYLRVGAYVRERTHVLSQACTERAVLGTCELHAA